jgi:hypothetical protein
MERHPRAALARRPHHPFNCGCHRTVREHEARPGVDARHEVLHRLERARNEQEVKGAAKAFFGWAKELDLLAPATLGSAPTRLKAIRVAPGVCDL